MRIESVTATAFGDIHGLRLDLADGLNLVVGPNGSGKSTWHAAMYAALCGQVTGPGETEFDRTLEDEHAPWDGDRWEVNATVRTADGKRIVVGQDLRGGRPAAVEIDGVDRSGDFADEGGADLTPLVGLDRRSFAACAWVQQEREALIRARLATGRGPLAHAVAAYLGLDAADAAVAGIARARLKYLDAGSAGSAWARAEARVEQTQHLVGYLHIQRDRQARLGQDLPRLRAEEAAAQRRLDAAEAAVAHQEADALTQEYMRMNPVRVAVPADSWSAVNTLPSQRGVVRAEHDSRVHSDVATAAQTYRQAKRALAETDGANGTPAEPPRPSEIKALADVDDRPAMPALPAAPPVRMPIALPIGPLISAGIAATAMLVVAGLVALIAGAIGVGLALLGVGALAGVGTAVLHRRRPADPAPGTAVAPWVAPAPVPAPPPAEAAPSALLKFAEAKLGVARVEQEHRVRVAAAGRVELEHRFRVAAAALAEELHRRGHPTSADRVEEELAEYEAECARRGDEEARRTDEVEDKRRRMEAARQRATSLSAGLNQYEIQAQSGANVADLRSEHERIREELARAEGEYAAVTAGLEDVLATRDPEEEHATAVAERDRLVALDRVLVATARALNAARAREFENVRRGMEEQLYELMPTITDGANEIRVDEQLQFHLGKPGRGRGGRTRGSHSQVDGSAVFARVALGRHLAGIRTPVPLLLDDVTSGADEDRLFRILDRLHMIAQQRQVVVFAHDPTTTVWARQQIENGRRIHLIRLRRPDVAPESHRAIEPRRPEISHRTLHDEDGS
jgi:energy-coupling factor transporter ATP-binding protein EcfA2